MLEDLEELQRLLQKIERNHEKVTVALRQFHDAAAQALADHGAALGLDSARVAAFFIPKDPK